MHTAVGATGATAPPSGRTAPGCRRRRACGVVAVRLGVWGSTGLAARENGHVSRAILSRYSHVRMEAKRCALDEIAARQCAADEKRKEEAEPREQVAAVSQSAVVQ